MEFILKHLSAIGPGVLAICATIVLGGVLLYVFWAWPKLSSTSQMLKKFALLVEARDPASGDFAPLNEAAKATPWLQQAWKMTESRLMLVGQGDKQRRVLLGSVNDVWQPERLVHTRLNLPLFEAVPNIAVGVGLFFTFLFLTLVSRHSQIVG